jgi:hypothetical protein
MAFVSAAAFAIVVAACGSAAASAPPASPSAEPSASVAPSRSPVTTPEAAAGLVLASDARFSGIQPKTADMIGQCCFYEVTPKGSDYTVTIEIGWGDCPAGCINRHRWTYTVTNAGQLRFEGEEGPTVPAGVPGTGAGTTGTGSGDGGVAGIRGAVSAGPTCPVVVSDGDPSCANRPVAGATVHVLDATGLEVAEMTTNAAGSFTVTLPAGRYRLEADPVDGLMGNPSPTDVAVDAGLTDVELAYDTGIR